MSQATINVRMDEGLKNAFSELVDQLGLSMSAAFTLFAKTAVREQRIPFPLELNRYSSQTLKAMEEAERIAGDTSIPSYRSTKELFAAKGWDR